ncbi:MAG: ATP-binding protein [Gammaproteobacteria bacterium]|nr:ATP-binding protein [Gammaproteobacteria bacterium]
MRLYPRYIEPVLKAALADTPVVCLLGPRQAGKTTLAQQLKPKRAYISFDDQSLVVAAKNDPVGFVQGLPDPVILDEVQRVPELMPAIKSDVDSQRSPGRFLLTGSANLLLLPRVQESLAGRMEVVQLNPLSEMEKQRSKNSLLRALLVGDITTRISARQNSVQGVPEAICAGGYPEPNTRTSPRARQWYKQYLNAIIQRDVKDIAAIRDENELSRLIELLAYRTASLLNISSLANDLGVDRATAEKYLTILERLYLIRRLPAWHRNNAKRLIKTPKVHVIDSGLAAMLNRLTIKDWKMQSTEFGALLESFVVQQLICQAGWVDSDLAFSHYRDKDKVEVDLVIEQGRKIWAVEVKRAASLQDKDGAGLARIAARAGKNFQGGILLYSGANCLSLKVDKCFAVPMNRLWA